MTVSDTKKTAIILGTFAVTEGAWVIINFVAQPVKFLHYLGFGGVNHGNILAWGMALIVVFLFIKQGLKYPSVRENLFKLSFLKLLAFGVAVFAGILEEVMFRKWLMDVLSAKGIGIILQVIGSGLAFGLIHGIWGLFGKKKRAALGATIATGLLGSLLAVVYIFAGRVVAPCIAAHFLINVLMEPGLVLAAVKGEMGMQKMQPLVNPGGNIV